MTLKAAQATKPASTAEPPSTSTGRAKTAVVKAAIASRERALAEAAAVQDWMRAAEELRGLTELHQAEFTVATPPLASPPSPVDARAIRKDQPELQGDELAAEVERQRAVRWADYEAEQAELDRQWDRLLANDPATVLEVSAAAFDDNEAPAAVVGMEGADASLMVLVPTPTVLPAKEPTYQPDSGYQVGSMRPEARGEYYRRLVMGHLLVTVKEAFAVLPGVEGVRAVVVRHASAGLECLAVARFERGTFTEADFKLMAWHIVHQIARDVQVDFDVGSEGLRALDLSGQPELQVLLAQVEHVLDE